MATGQYDFSVATYNILAKSLGTNCIPWVMNVSPEIKDRIVDVTGAHSFRDWVSQELTPQYLQHFHKNFNSGNYAAMRSFWGYPNCLKSDDDIPFELQGGLKWVDEDIVSYSTGDPPKTVQATTLRGLAKQHLPPDVFDDFFYQEIISKEESIYHWKVRGPRIVQTLMNLSTIEDGETSSQSPPDIISIQEYDCHDVVANYLGDDDEESSSTTTFAEAMSSMDYSGIFLKDPLLGRDPPSGMGVFWRNDVFETAVSGIFGMDAIECNSYGFDDSIYNFDLREYWHPITKGDESSCSSIAALELMKAADRRNGGICRLRHKKTGKIVALCTAHLMTTSRDSIKTNLFPGEVRAGEVATLKKTIETNEMVKPDDTLIFVGDFNTDVKDANQIFSGKIPSSSLNNKEEILEFNTGFDNGSGTFQWGSSNRHQLRDAFANQHQWGNNVSTSAVCTSRNMNRVEWIDYIFYDSNKIQVTGTSDCSTPPNGIPDEIHPSDHLPLLAKFRFN